MNGLLEEHGSTINISINPGTIEHHGGVAPLVNETKVNDECPTVVTLTTTFAAMESKLTIMQRPLGPRSITRSSSPLPMGIARTPPLNIRKASNTISPPTSPPTRSALPSLTLNIPAPPSRPTTPKPSIRLAIPALNGKSSDHPSGSDSPLFESYYGGPGGPALEITATGHSDEMTIRPTPLSINVETCIPPKTSSAAHGVSDVKGLLDNLNDTPLTFSDDFLEELSRLGEGAGGAVHKVKDKRTGKIMARKTITTREAPMKQLLREVSIISSTQHVNIILFHGAYMSPSSSEVKILMEFGEGGSLETVGKRIKDRGAIVGEKIAGRLAEGVSHKASNSSALSSIDIILGTTRPCLSSYKEDHSQRYQAIEYLAVSRRHRQAV
jgi:mitogen-activated protein kinase kinase